MVTYIEMVDAAPSTWDGNIPTASVVERWTKEVLFGFVQLRNILQNASNLAIFREADIDADTFLTCGDDLYFWAKACHLPAAPSYRLAELVRTINNVGKQESRGNAFHLGSD